MVLGESWGAMSGKDQQAAIDWLLLVVRQQQTLTEQLLTRIQALEHRMPEAVRGIKEMTMSLDCRIHELEQRLSDGSWSGSK